MSQLKRHIIVTLLLWLVVGFSFAQDKVATKPQKESEITYNGWSAHADIALLS